MNEGEGNDNEQFTGIFGNFTASFTCDVSDKEACAQLAREKKVSSRHIRICEYEPLDVFRTAESATQGHDNHDGFRRKQLIEVQIDLDIGSGVDAFDEMALWKHHIETDLKISVLRTRLLSDYKNRGLHQFSIQDEIRKDERRFYYEFCTSFQSKTQYEQLLSAKSEWVQLQSKNEKNKSIQTVKNDETYKEEEEKQLDKIKRICNRYGACCAQRKDWKISPSKPFPNGKISETTVDSERQAAACTRILFRVKASSFEWCKVQNDMLIERLLRATWGTDGLLTTFSSPGIPASLLPTCKFCLFDECKANFDFYDQNFAPIIPRFVSYADIK